MIPVVPHVLQPEGALRVYDVLHIASEMQDRESVEDQPEYYALPVSRSPDGIVMTEWKMTPDEHAILQAGGRVRLWVHTSNRPILPFALEIVPEPTCSNPLVQ